MGIEMEFNGKKGKAGEKAFKESLDNLVDRVEKKLNHKGMTLKNRLSSKDISNPKEFLVKMYTELDKKDPNKKHPFISVNDEDTRMLTASEILDIIENNN